MVRKVNDHNHHPPAKYKSMNSGRLHLANGTQFDWWAPPTVIGYNNSRRCITDYYINELQSITYTINNVQIDVPLAGEPFSPITLRHIGALRLAYNALKKTPQMNLFHMPGTNFTSEQTFFLAYAQTQCYQRQELAQYTRTKSGIYDERTALNTALVHMPEFAQTFQCKYPDNPCFD